eukprot:m.251886 g.251886  ORF g.251886 m.251886 type:complete len:247 (-) comp15463_c0_seq1:3526-4266(-)
MSQVNTLIVFDFDQTVTPDDTDQWVINAFVPDLMPVVTARFREGEQWTNLMDWALQRVQENHSLDDVRAALGEMELPEPLCNALAKLQQLEHTEHIILSDANTFYIDALLNHHGKRHLFDHVITNPASHDESGTLRVTWYMPDGHKCERCAACPNLCKGQTMSELVSAKAPHRSIYVGDGSNDFCAALSLGENDVVLARTGFSLAKLLTDNAHLVRAKWHLWETYSELHDLLLEEGAQTQPVPIQA